MADDKTQNITNLIQHFEKSPQYRSILATGIYGGPTINGFISANIITDLTAMPTTTESQNQGNRLVQVKSDFGGKMAIREVQCAILMNLDTAKLFQEWLTNHINILENAIKQSINK